MKKLLCLNKKLHSAVREFITIRGNTVILNEETNTSLEPEQISKLMKSKKCTLYLRFYSDHLVLGRSYNNEIIDYYTFKINKIIGTREFPTLPPEYGSKYYVLVQNCVDKRLENLVIDLLHQPSHEVDFEGTSYAWIFAQVDGVYTLKYMRVTLSGMVEDIGPFFELTIENSYNCGEEIWKDATKVEKKKTKNVEKNVCKETIGKVHIDRQDLRDIRLKRGRGYKNERN